MSDEPIFHQMDAKRDLRFVTKLRVFLNLSVLDMKKIWRRANIVNDTFAKERDAS